MTTTGSTRASNGLLMSKRQYQRQPSGHRMAAFACVRGLRMVGRFAGYTPGRAVVTTGSGAGLSRNSTMIKTHLPPIRDAGVATITGVAGRHMVSTFSCGNDVIVASGASIAALIMGERRNKIIPAGPGCMA